MPDRDRTETVRCVLAWALMYLLIVLGFAAFIALVAGHIWLGAGLGLGAFTAGFAWFALEVS
jgi:hypothetical protein